MKKIKCYVIRIYFRVKLIVIFQKQSNFFLIIVLQLKNYFVLTFRVTSNDDKTRKR